MTYRASDAQRHHGNGDDHGDGLGLVAAIGTTMTSSASQRG